ncbi:MAG: MFS transporter, partial [Cyanophyceae cyanobacterium]
DSQVLGTVSAAAGIGGVIGAVLISIWGGPKRRIRGVLGGMIGAGLSKMLFGLGRSIAVWAPTQGVSSLNFPLIGSCRGAILMDAIAPALQGRVFAAKSLVIQISSAIATMCSGPLADRLFEPAMQPGGVASPWLGTIFGSGAGAGTAVMYTACSLSLVLIGLWGLLNPRLRTFETWENTPQQHTA